MSTHSDEETLTEPMLRHRADGKRKTALLMVEDRQHCREAWMAAGYAIEFALKALIMRQQDMNTWPNKASRPELHTHSLKRLMQEAQIELSAVPSEMRASIRQVLDWERRHDYIGLRMPRKAARSMVHACFGEHGVLAWLNGK